MGVLFCDVDDFKLVNDRWGHDAGDQLLCQIADCLRAATRETDTVSRFAGDEFVIVCPGLGTPEEFETIIERVNRSLQVPHSDDGVHPQPRVSIGAALLENDETAVDVLRRSDEAMYRRKATKSPVLAGSRAPTA